MISISHAAVFCEGNHFFRPPAAGRNVVRAISPCSPPPTRVVARKSGSFAVSVDGTMSYRVSRRVFTY